MRAPTPDPNLSPAFGGPVGVNEQRLWQSLMEMARHGALPNGGCCRLALSAEDRDARDLLVRWAREAGCDVTWDTVGNIYARRRGTSPWLPAVATGSHLDTQPRGGRFDGVFGVLAGLEVIRTLNEHGIETVRPCDLIVWTSEEGTRFMPPMAGSAVFSGALGVAELQDSMTVDGTNVLDDLRNIGYLGTEVPGSRRLHTFIEAHIEQGPVLERENKTVGIVDGVQGARVYEVQVTGDDGHAGTVPLSARRDACVGAAEMVLFLNQLGVATDELTRITVGVFEVQPGSISTIPGNVIFTIDCRHPDAGMLSALFERIEAGLRAIASKRALDITVTVRMERSPIAFDPDVVDLLRSTADGLGLPYRLMSSGAGHDAMNIATVVPSGMIFVPCKDGVSHNERESATPGDLAAGANVLLHAMIQCAVVSVPDTLSHRGTRD